MSPEGASALIAGGGFLLSVASSMFIAGSRWGEVKTKLAELEANKVTKNDVQGMGERLARIEGMFELRLKDGGP